MDPLLAQIIMFGGNFAPRGWAFCDGQLMDIASNTALFSILGTTYGGDGRTTFALPDLRGRFPMHPGTGPGLSTRRLGEKQGTQTNTLNVNNMPSHNHTTVAASNLEGDQTSPVGNNPAVSDDRNYVNDPSAPGNTGNNGGNQPFNNMPPYLGLNFIIALQGLYPSRS
jgi:microcystin-dependent protein